MGRSFCAAIGLSRRVDAGTTYRTPFGNKRTYVSVRRFVYERARVPATAVAREYIIDRGSPWIGSISHFCGATANIPRCIYRCTRVAASTRSPVGLLIERNYDEWQTQQHATENVSSLSPFNFLRSAVSSMSIFILHDTTPNLLVFDLCNARARATNRHCLENPPLSRYKRLEFRIITSPPF